MIGRLGKFPHQIKLISAVSCLRRSRSGQFPCLFLPPGLECGKSSTTSHNKRNKKPRWWPSTCVMDNNRKTFFLPPRGRRKQNKNLRHQVHLVSLEGEWNSFFIALCAPFVVPGSSRECRKKGKSVWENFMVVRWPSTLSCPLVCWPLSAWLHKVRKRRDADCEIIYLYSVELSERLTNISIYIKNEKNLVRILIEHLQRRIGKWFFRQKSSKKQLNFNFLSPPTRILLTQFSRKQTWQEAPAKFPFFALINSLRKPEEEKNFPAEF